MRDGKWLSVSDKDIGGVLMLNSIKDKTKNDVFESRGHDCPLRATLDRGLAHMLMI